MVDCTLEAQAGRDGHPAVAGPEGVGEDRVLVRDPPVPLALATPEVRVGHVGPRWATGDAAWGANRSNGPCNNYALRRRRGNTRIATINEIGYESPRTA